MKPRYLISLVLLMLSITASAQLVEYSKQKRRTTNSPTTETTKTSKQSSSKSKSKNTKSNSNNYVNQEATINGLKYDLKSDGTAEVASQEEDNNLSGDIVIPSKVTYKGKTYTVTSLEENCFFQCSRIKSINLPSSIMSLGDWCFYGCSNLASMNIPSRVTSLGNGCFFGCKSLISIDIPSKVISIGKSCFYDCESLTSIYIPSSVKSLGDWCFNRCGRLKSINIPSRITSLGEYCFSDCESLTSINIPSSVKSLGDWCFNRCGRLESINIPSRITSLGEYCFSNCESLTSINIPSGVTSIGESCFSGCCSLVAIKVATGNKVYDSRNNCNAIIETKSNKMISGCNTTIIPSSVTSLGNDCFRGCKSLTSINIPSSVTSLGYGCFSDCSSLSSINIPSSVTSIGYDCFDGCGGLTSITVAPGNRVYDSRNNCNAIIETKTNKMIRGCNTTIIPPSVTSVGGSGFSGCKSLTSINIPSSVTSIYSDCFNGCGNLTSITVASGNRVYDSRNNCNAIIETKTNTMIRGCRTTIIPSSVTSLGEYCFRGCASLTSINIPSSITSIGYFCFDGCNNLTSIIFNSSSLPKLEDTGGSGEVFTCYVFDGVENLTIYVPKEYLNEYKVKLSEHIWISTSFYGKYTVVAKGTSASAQNTAKPVSMQTRAGNTIAIEGVEFVLRGDGTAEVVGLGEDASARVVIPGEITHDGKKYAVTSLGDKCFADCVRLYAVTIPEGVTSLGSGCFGGCTKLMNVTFEGATPPQVGSNVLENAERVIIYVSRSALSSYSSWVKKNFNGKYVVMGK